MVPNELEKVKVTEAGAPTKLGENEGAGKLLVVPLTEGVVMNA